ncbi:MAG: hypothetical protein JWR80_4155 [Bradyrhizobium sp.]|nr:hypothetical protein [Bradyrhizobium sp.]
MPRSIPSTPRSAPGDGSPGANSIAAVETGRDAVDSRTVPVNRSLSGKWLRSSALQQSLTLPRGGDAASTGRTAAETWTWLHRTQFIAPIQTGRDRRAARDPCRGPRVSLLPADVKRLARRGDRQCRARCCLAAGFPDSDHVASSARVAAADSVVTAALIVGSLSYEPYPSGGVHRRSRRA